MEQNIEYTSMLGERKVVSIKEAQDILLNINPKFNANKFKEHVLAGWIVSYNDNTFILKNDKRERKE